MFNLLVHLLFTLTQDAIPHPSVQLELLDLSSKGHKGPAVTARLSLTEGQCITFVLRTPPTKDAVGGFDDPPLTKELVSGLKLVR